MNTNIRAIIEIALESVSNGTDHTDAHFALEFAIAVLSQLEHPDLDEAIGVLEEISHHEHAVVMRAE